MKTCIVQSCSKQAVYKNGFCRRHYRQHRRGALDNEGNYLHEVRAKRADHSPASPCKMENCENPVHAKGFCHTHKSQHWLGIIDEDGNRLRARKTKRGSRRTKRYGYVLIYLPEHHRADTNGYVREHIVVMEEKLGRRLIEGEIVHHKNGKKDDNRPENLELRVIGTHEPGHDMSLELVIETLKLSNDWDKEVLRQILASKHVKFSESSPDPTGGLTPLLKDKSEPASEEEHKCKLPKCVLPAKSKGMCWKHYYRFRRGIADENGNLTITNKGGLPRGFVYVRDGYVKVLITSHTMANANGYALVHRVVMSNYLGRPLESDEVVHHRNGNRSDNRLENLQLMSRSDNARGYIVSAEDALKFLAVTWPAGEEYRETLEELL